jgi:hypothetical protein
MTDKCESFALSAQPVTSCIMCTGHRMSQLEIDRGASCWNDLGERTTQNNWNSLHTHSSILAKIEVFYNHDHCNYEQVLCTRIRIPLGTIIGWMTIPLAMIGWMRAPSKMDSPEIYLWCLWRLLILSHYESTQDMIPYLPFARMSHHVNTETSAARVFGIRL